MDPQIRSIRKETVMCMMEGCPNGATVAVADGFEGSPGGQAVLAAYCDHHAEEAANRFRNSTPAPERLPAVRAGRGRAFRAGCA